MNESLGRKLSAHLLLSMDPSMQHGQTRQTVRLMCRTTVWWSPVASAPLLGIQSPFDNNLILHVAPGELRAGGVVRVRDICSTGSELCFQARTSEGRLDKAIYLTYLTIKFKG